MKVAERDKNSETRAGIYRDGRQRKAGKYFHLRSADVEGENAASVANVQNPMGRYPALLDQ